MKKVIKPLLLLATMALTACGGTSSQVSSIVPKPSSEQSSEVPSQTSSAVSSKEEPSVVSSEIISSQPSSEKKTIPEDVKYVTDLLWFPDQKIEVGQKQYMGSYLLEFKDSEILIADGSMLEIDENGYLLGKAVGETYIAYHANGKYQKVNISIAKAGSYKRAYRFDDIAAELKDKNISAFGDSVTADATVGDTSSVYPRKFALKYKMNFIENYAVGGTTGSYSTFNENIMKEYGGTKYQYLDGCDLVYNHRNDLKTVDYLFISYGYNDLYYQVKIDDERDSTYCADGTFACCHSFKGAYRYMINVARKANPDIQIICNNINFNEYDPDSGAFGKGYKFDTGLRQIDYRKAIFEIGYEMDVKVIDTWNYTKNLYDKDEPEGVYKVYKDYVHLTKFGQNQLSKYIFKW